MATYVLVHGSGDGGWIWKKISPLLRSRGNEVFTPTLTGLGDRSHIKGCEVDLYTHISDVANLIKYEDLSKVILVGHSYAGMVITGVAAEVPERLSQMIYLDAYLPDEGQSEADLWTPDMRDAILGNEAATSGIRLPSPATMFGIIDKTLEKWIMERSTPHPLACYMQAPPYGIAKSAVLKYSYIHCTEGITAPVFATFATKAKAKGWDVYTLKTGHLVMLTFSDELADLLISIAETDNME